MFIAHTTSARCSPPEAPRATIDSDVRSIDSQKWTLDLCLKDPSARAPANEQAMYFLRQSLCLEAKKNIAF